MPGGVCGMALCISKVESEFDRLLNEPRVHTGKVLWPDGIVLEMACAAGPDLHTAYEVAMRG